MRQHFASPARAGLEDVPAYGGYTARPNGLIASRIFGWLQWIFSSNLAIRNRVLAEVSSGNYLGASCAETARLYRHIL